MRKHIAEWLGWVAVGGLFIEGLAWLLRVDLTHYIEMRERPSLAYCDRVTQTYWTGGAL